MGLFLAIPGAEWFCPGLQLPASPDRSLLSCSDLYSQDVAYLGKWNCAAGGWRRFWQGKENTQVGEWIKFMALATGALGWGFFSSYCKGKRNQTKLNVWEGWDTFHLSGILVCSCMCQLGPTSLISCCSSWQCDAVLWEKHCASLLELIQSSPQSRWKKAKGWVMQQCPWLALPVIPSADKTASRSGHAEGVSQMGPHAPPHATFCLSQPLKALLQWGRRKWRQQPLGMYLETLGSTDGWALLGLGTGTWHWWWQCPCSGMGGWQAWGDVPVSAAFGGIFAALSYSQDHTDH